MVLKTFVDAREKGAVGDGITNDTAAIQAAYDAAVASGGKALFLPPGYDFKIDQLLIDPGEHNVTIFGWGYHSKLTQRTPGTPVIRMAGISNAVGDRVSEPILRDFAIVGAQAGGGTTGHGIHASYVHRARFQNLFIEGLGGDGIRFDGTGYDNVVSECVIWLNDAVGIRDASAGVNGITPLTLLANRIEGNKVGGVESISPTLQVWGGTYENNVEYDFYLHDGCDATLTAVHLEVLDINRPCILIGDQAEVGVPNITFVGCEFYGNKSGTSTTDLRAIRIRKAGHVSLFGGFIQDFVTGWEGDAASGGNVLTHGVRYINNTSSYVQGGVATISDERAGAQTVSGVATTRTGAAHLSFSSTSELRAVTRGQPIPVGDPFAVDELREKTANAGVTVDGLLIKDGVIPSGGLPGAFLVDGTRALTSNLDAGGNRLTNIADGQAATDGVSKGQLDAALQGLDWQESVLDRDLTAPPGAPATGDRYIVAAVGSGTWLGQDNNIAEWDGAQWVFTAPNEGYTLTVEDEDRIVIWTGATWAYFGSRVDHGQILGLTDDDHMQYMHKDVARTVTAVHTHNPAAPGPAWVLGANAQGQKVVGLDADTVDGVEAAALAQRTAIKNGFFSKKETPLSQEWIVGETEVASYTPGAQAMMMLQKVFIGATSDSNLTKIVRVIWDDDTTYDFSNSSAVSSVNMWDSQVWDDLIGATSTASNNGRYIKEIKILVNNTSGAPITSAPNSWTIGGLCLPVGTGGAA